MKYIIIFILSVFITSCNTTKNLTKDETLKYQEELVAFYNNTETTPLNSAEKELFKGITFFPINNTYKINADYQSIKDGNILPFPTSAGKIKYYKEYALASFTLNNTKHSLTIYQSYPIMEDYATHLFLPFTDNTNGETTYGGGRYIDLDSNEINLVDNKILIDFNKAYNPYCAYSKRYNCPIPPSNNFLDTDINAGVTYKK